MAGLLFLWRPTRQYREFGSSALLTFDSQRPLLGQLFGGSVGGFGSEAALLTGAGTRGATSAEYFLSAGYAVIFLHRLHSLRPFSRHYSHSLNPFLDLLSVVPASSSSDASSSTSPTIIVPPEHAKTLLPILQAHQRSQAEGTLLSVDFQTINEYLWLLKSATSLMAPLGRRGMFYLAAAVSDFFLPEDRIVGVSAPSYLPRLTWRTRPSTKYSLVKGRFPSKWTKCQRC